MFIFSIILYTLCLVSFRDSIKREISKSEIVELFIFGILMLLIAACRTKGYDYQSYKNIYNLCNSGITQGQDPGFTLLCIISPSYRILLILMAALSIIPLIKLCKEWSPIPVFSLLIVFTLVFFPGVMGQMRQNVATMLILLAYYYRKEHNKKYIFILAYAVTIHTAAILGILYFVPMKRRYSFVIYMAIFIASIACSSIIQNIFGDYIGLFGSIAQDKFEVYNQLETQRNVSLGLNTAVLIRIIVFTLAYIYLKGTKYDNPQFLNIYFISIVWYMLFSFLPQLGSRGSAYFSILDIFLIPQIIYSLKSYQRIICSIGFIVLSILRFYQFFGDDFNSNSYLPYFN